MKITAVVENETVELLLETADLPQESSSKAVSAAWLYLQKTVQKLVSENNPDITGTSIISAQTAATYLVLEQKKLLEKLKTTLSPEQIREVTDYLSKLMKNSAIANAVLAFQNAKKSSTAAPTATATPTPTATPTIPPATPTPGTSSL